MSDTVKELPVVEAPEPTVCSKCGASLERGFSGTRTSKVRKGVRYLAWEDAHCFQCADARRLREYEQDGIITNQLYLACTLPVNAWAEAYRDRKIPSPTQVKVAMEFYQIWGVMQIFSGRKWKELQELHKAEKSLRYASATMGGYEVGTGVMAGRLQLQIEDKETNSLVCMIGYDEPYKPEPGSAYEKIREEMPKTDYYQCGDSCISATKDNAIKLLRAVADDWDIKRFKFKKS